MKKAKPISVTYQVLFLLEDESGKACGTQITTPIAVTHADWDSHAIEFDSLSRALETEVNADGSGTNREQRRAAAKTAVKTMRASRPVKAKLRR